MCISGEINNLHNENHGDRLSAQTVGNTSVLKGNFRQRTFTARKKLQTATLGKRTAPSVHPLPL